MTAERPAVQVGRFGIWTGVFTDAHKGALAWTAAFDDAIAELDSLGFGTLWLGGSPSVGAARRVLDATARITVATGILSIWEHTAEAVAAQTADIRSIHPGRFVLGLGVSHQQYAPAYSRPYSAMLDYLEVLDKAAEPVLPQERILAALSPKMLALARARAAGAHPYLVTADFVAAARTSLGPDPLLAPELKVVIDADLSRARDTARGYLRFYLEMPNYLNSLRRQGFSDGDFDDGGSNRLVHALFALGDADVAAARAQEFLAAGANHVALQVVTDDPFANLPRAGWRVLAQALNLTERGTL